MKSAYFYNNKEDFNRTSMERKIFDYIILDD